MTQTPATTSSPADAGSKAAANADQPSPYAIVESSGQQFWLQPNRYYDIDRLAADVDSTVNLENVLLVNDGKAATLGQPYVAGATVELKVMAHRRGPKLIVYKMRPKKKTRRKNGHRQELTRVMVQSIKVAGKALS
jgi:large subunit ribosomal protein L21